jgi:50S ribosomal protein L16 3-hydroxylase
VGEAEGGRISEHARKKVRATLREFLAPDDAELDRWFGCFITEPKPWLATLAPDMPVAPDGLRRALRSGRTLRRSPYARIHFIPAPDGGALLFCDGESRKLDAKMAPLAPVLARHRQLTQADIGDALDNDAVCALLTDWYNRGKYYFDDE